MDLTCFEFGGPRRLTVNPRSLGFVFRSCAKPGVHVSRKTIFRVSKTDKDGSVGLIQRKLWTSHTYYSGDRLLTMTCLRRLWQRNGSVVPLGERAFFQLPRTKLYSWYGHGTFQRLDSFGVEYYLLGTDCRVYLNVRLPDAKVEITYSAKLKLHL